jgi:hypothetical protein
MSFCTQIHYNLCHRHPKIPLWPYQKYLGPSMIPCVDIFMTTKKFWHYGRSILAGFIHHNLLSEWFKSFKYLSTSVLIDVLNFLPKNKKATRWTILSNLKNRRLCRRKSLMSLSISVGQELWLLCRRMQIKVLGRRRCVTPGFEAKTRCSSYVCPGSSCHTYGQNVNTEKQCLYYIKIITWDIVFTQKTKLTLSSSSSGTHQSHRLLTGVNTHL